MAIDNTSLTLKLLILAEHKAIDNWVENFTYFWPEKDVENFAHQATVSADFEWLATDQGHKYWNDINKDIANYIGVYS